jgi:hypothetical protein
MSGYREFNHDLVIESGSSSRLIITPARGVTLEIYNIYSKHELGQDQLDLIRTCLQARERKSLCEKEGEYIIMGEI